MNLEDLISRAWTDHDFRQRLLRDPKPVIEDALGVSLPAELTVQVHEDTPTTLHLVLPRRPVELPSHAAPAGSTAGDPAAPPST